MRCFTFISLSNYFSTPKPSTNEPLTAEQSAFLRESISARRRELDVLMQTINVEETKSCVLTAAIAGLEQGCTQTKSFLASQEKLLSNLIQSKKDISPPALVVQPLSVFLPQEAANTALSHVNNQVNKGLKDLSQQISTLETTLAQLRLSSENRDGNIH